MKARFGWTDARRDLGRQSIAHPVIFNARTIAVHAD
jgi:hypothetical protein